MKRSSNLFLRIGLFAFALIILFVAYFVFVNLSKTDPKEILDRLPSNITPKYTESDVWWKQTSVYQIYPRSYKDSDGDGIGDIAGIISKLDYIQALGFETIWISPFFKSPQRDHGYDVSGYREIDSVYGDQQLVDSLINEVHRRDMKIIFDMVLNHTSNEHPWFLESKSSNENPKSDWYVWRDGKDGGPPNNWKNILGSESGWNYVEERDQYYYTAFLPVYQPDLNMWNPEVQAAVMDMIKHWMDSGVDGMRLDIFNFIFEDPEYPDNPSTLRLLPDFGEKKWLFREHEYNFHHPEVIQFAKKLRALLEAYPEGKFMVGEVFGSHYEMRELMGLESYDGLNLVFIFDFIEDFNFSSEYFGEKAQEYDEMYPHPLVPTFVFSNHDQLRSIKRMDNDPQRAEVLAAFQMTLRGVPFTYQGEEIGMEQGRIPFEEAQDPVAKYWLKYPAFLREAMPSISNRDNCRTPMQWDGSSNAGFSAGNGTWLPVQENYRRINVDEALNDPKSLLNTYKALLKLRAEHPILKSGNFRMLDEGIPEDVLAYERSDGNSSIQVWLNFSDEARDLPEHLTTKAVLLERRVVRTPQLALEKNGILILKER